MESEAISIDEYLDSDVEQIFKFDSLVQKNLCQIHRIVTQKYHR